MRKSTDAKEELNKALQLDGTYPADRKSQEEAKQLLKGL
jgi:hypothetical protein